MSAPVTREWMAPSAWVDSTRMRAIVVATLGLIATGVGFALDREQFYRSYLVGWIYVLGVPMGSLAIMMLHHVTKGAWGVVIRRPLEAATRTLPLMVLLFLPVLLGMRTLFPWMDPEVVAHDPIIAGKTPYLNQTFFLARFAIYFVVWIGLALMIGRLSQRQDESGDPILSMRMQGISGIGLVLYVLTASFASFDWLMSLDAHWFSSIYGIWFVGSHNLAALAFMIPVAMSLGRREPMEQIYRPSHFHDYGKLLLAFTMLWAYFSLSQFLIIWSGNLPEDIPWYLTRTEGNWQYIAQALVFLHFALPFLLLLSTDIKRDAKRLAFVAGLILVMRWVDLYWQAAPSMGSHAFSWMDLTAPLGLGGLWLAAFLTELKKRPLLPINEPFLEEAVGHD